MRTDDPRPWPDRFKARPAIYLLVVATALATGGRYALDPILGDTSQYVTFYFATMLVASAGGLVPGLGVTGLGALLSMWLFVEPRGELSVGSSADLVRLLAFLTVGIGVSLIGERVHVHRRRAEAQTAELHEMLELVDLGHLLVRGTDDRIIRWTAGCQRLYGYTAGEAIGRVSHQLLQTESSVPVEAIHERLQEHGRWEGELTHRHKDGRRVTVASLWVLYRDAAGKPAAILESNNNISGLRGTEERLRLVLDAARIGTWDWGLPGGELEWSHQCKELFGLPPDAAMSYERFLETVHPDDRQRVEQSAQAALGHKTEYDVEFRTIWPDGSGHWIASHGQGYYDGSGRPYRMAGASMDITERKGMEEKIGSIAQFSEENPSPVLRLRHDGQVLYANQAAANFLADMSASAEEGCPPVLRAATDQALGTGREQELEVSCAKGRTFSFFCVPVPQRRYANLYGRDVTEAQRAERALHDSERRFRGTFENAAVGIAHIDPEGRFLHVNEKLRVMLGRGCDELRGRRSSDLTHPEDRAEDMNRFAAMIRGEVDTDILEKRYVRPDGSSLWVLVTRTVQRDDTGRGEYAISIVQDITERKRAEQALLESEGFARKILASSLSGLYIFDLPGRVLSYVSPQYTRLTGYTLDQLRAMSGDAFLALFHPEDQEKVAAHIAAAGRAREDEVREIEYRFKTDDGRWIWCLSRETAFECDADGAVKRYLGSFLDVTERKEAEETLRNSESFYRQALESIPGMVFTTRPDGYCDYQSQQWVDYTRVPMREHLGDGWNRLLHPDDRPRAAAAWRAAVNGQAPYDLEYRVRRHDGQYEWFKVIGRPIHDAEGRVVKWFGVALNIADLKRAEGALAAARISAERARAAAEEASAAKDHFLAVLSHELRTPLSPVVTGISLLENEKTLSARAQSILSVVRRNVELESRLIDDLLDLTRVARGKVDLDKHSVELCTILDRAIEVCRPDIEARGLHFGVDYGPRPYLVDADAARLQQVFWNLLKNAIKFTPLGGCVGFRCRPDNGDVVVEVNDSGIGIEQADLNRIFDAFAQAERSLKRQFGGLGLGLAISKALVEMHGGRIEAHSGGLNMGATFRVRLPLASARAEEDGETPTTLAGVSNSGRRPLRVLVVEDHGDSADMLAAVLESEGHQVVKAADFATALDLVTRTRFDLLLSDLGLPDRSGLELIREVRSRGLGIPAFALSGYGQEQDVERSRTAGFSHHFVKPVDPGHLLEAIRRLVRAPKGVGRHHEGADLEP